MEFYSKGTREQGNVILTSCQVNGTIFVQFLSQASHIIHITLVLLNQDKKLYILHKKFGNLPKIISYH
jgi:hypothetical protein